MLEPINPAEKSQKREPANKGLLTLILAASVEGMRKKAVAAEAEESRLLMEVDALKMQLEQGAADREVASSAMSALEEQLEAQRHVMDEATRLEGLERKMNVLDQDRELSDRVGQMLEASDLSRLAQVNTALQDEVQPLVEPVAVNTLGNVLDDKAAGGRKRKGVEKSEHVRHMDTKTDPEAALKKIDHLSEKGLIVTRALNESDAINLLSGKPLKGKGGSLDVAEQVRTGETNLISASARPSHAFSGGSRGHVAINTPKHIEAVGKLAKKYPKTVTRGMPTVSPSKLDFVSHEQVMEAVKSENTKDQMNARNAKEVMFRKRVGIEHVVVLDGGVPQRKVEESKAAKARKEEKTTRASATAVDNSKEKISLLVKYFKKDPAYKTKKGDALEKALAIDFAEMSLDAVKKGSAACVKWRKDRHWQAQQDKEEKSSPGKGTSEQKEKERIRDVEEGDETGDEGEEGGHQ